MSLSHLIKYWSAGGRWCYAINSNVPVCIFFSSRFGKANNPGLWLLHCHMLEHAASGMAAILSIT
jgi:FtsP/CotA-like multicopper oxidase with cupredoxin domain